MTKQLRAKRIKLSDIIFSRHVQGKLVEFAISKEQALEIIASAIPYPNQKIPSQSRYCGKGICLVVDETTGVVITAYRDGVITPLRDDQKKRGIKIKRGGGVTSTLRNAEPKGLP